VFVPTVSVLLIQQCQYVPKHVGEHEYVLFSLVRARMPEKDTRFGASGP